MTKPLRCRVGLHDWREKYDHETAKPFRECAACGKRMSKGWPATLG